MIKSTTKLFFTTLLIFLFFPIASYTAAQDTIPNTSETKTGWSLGAVPVVAYDSDIGFKYGGVVNFYHYGDGSIYPDYKHSLYFEWSRTTKGSGINQFTYDSKYLIPGIRLSGEISYLTERALDFYGFNGYQSLYNSTFADDSPANSEYLSRQFYKQERNLLRLRADFSGKIKQTDFNWLLGITHYDIKLDTIDIDKLNKGQSNDKKLPPVNGGLYGNYKSWNTLTEKYYYGGQSTLLKLGLIYDSRDNEPNPMSGIWTELLMLLDPGLIGNNSYSYGKYSITHRQYFTILPQRLSFAYRVAYQAKLYGETPTYMLPFVFNSGRYPDRDGLGGAKTLRGILRNRIVGEDIAYGNFEFRWKFLRTVMFNQNIYLALSAFTDIGMVTREYQINTTEVNNDDLVFFSNEKEGLHQSIGGGLRIALNENFIVACDYGVSLDKRDGDDGLYINLNWLF